MRPYVVTDEGFLRLTVLPEDYEWAKARAEEMGALNNSIREGAGNLAGFLGESLVRRAFGCDQENTYNFDLRFGDDEGNATFEAKTKDRTVPPRLDYMASVANFNTRQQADYYVFISLVRPDQNDRSFFSEGYVVGLLRKTDYLSAATFMKKGQIDPTDSRGWKIKADCYNLAYRSLHRFDAWRE